jgi:hypothetical protein
VLYCRLYAIKKSLLDGKNPYGGGPFAGLRYGVNYMRAAAPPVAPWVGYKGYGASALCNTPYYEELIYHTALCGATKLLYFNPQVFPPHKPMPEWSNPDQDRVLDKCLRDVNERFGDLDRSPITTGIMPWDSPLVVSGMRVGDKSLWRVTAPPGVTKIEVLPSKAILDFSGGVGAWYTGKADERPTFERVVE